MNGRSLEQPWVLRFLVRIWHSGDITEELTGTRVCDAICFDGR
jgi:hypothetical protein